MRIVGEFVFQTTSFHRMSPLEKRFSENGLSDLS
jgi:hypothetical protein